MSFYIKRGEVQEGLRELAEASQAPASAISMVEMLIAALNSTTETRQMTQYVHNTQVALSAVETACGSKENPVRDLIREIERFYCRYHRD